jgi:flagellar protein FliS
LYGQNGLNQYRSIQAETVPPEDRVALLYDGARRFVDQALHALEVDNLPEVSHYAGKAQRILEELSGALNFEAGEMAENLFLLYEYWTWRLGQGIVKREPEAFKEVSAALMDMHGAWVEAAKQVRAQRGSRSVG